MLIFGDFSLGKSIIYDHHWSKCEKGYPIKSVIGKYTSNCRQEWNIFIDRDAQGNIPGSCESANSITQKYLIISIFPSVYNHNPWNSD